LPPGQWLGWWDGSVNEGGANGSQITVPADIDTLPLFVAAGGIVPMLRDTIQTLSPANPALSIESYANDPGVLWVRVAPGSSKTSFTLYDGAKITQQAAGHVPSLTFAPGQTPTFTQGAQFEIIATPQPSSVVNHGSALTRQPGMDALKASSDGWFWESATGGTLWVKVSGAASITIQ
jgi:alpha-D-xyloside xylohydrolase